METTQQSNQQPSQQQRKPGFSTTLVVIIIVASLFGGGLVGYTIQYDIFRRAYYSGVQGSGFIYNLNGKMIVITNNHVIQDTINNTVTFANGDTYSASVLGSDPYADLAALSAAAPKPEYTP